MLDYVPVVMNEFLNIAVAGVIFCGHNRVRDWLLPQVIRSV